ncbi:Nicotinate catabolism cluster-specific transcription factor [Colletotrichum sp. SAR 10_76]|nr:Nicotinate catabolism cluster-specific transcription factor [Colletotrichum sp. SAR 10_76]
MSDSQTAMAGSASYRHNSESSDGYLGEEKTFTCSHPGCSKRFTRAEHMQRHALNHQPGGLSCDICSAHFKRPDLLIGSISPDIQRRHTVDLRPASFDSNHSYPFDRGNLFATSETVNDFAGFPPALQFHDFGASDNHFDLDANQPINWGDPFSSEHLDYDQIFQPDTASSFNMPYTTALDYNWLFNMQEAAGPMITSKTSTQEYNTQLPENPSIARTQTNIAITPESMKSAQLWNDPMDVAPTDNSGQDKPPSYNTVIQSAPQELPPREPPKRPAPRSSAERNSDMNSARRAAEASGPTRKRYTAVSRPAPILEPERPLSSLRKPLNTPTIDEEIRERLLNTADAAKPCLPDQRYTIWEHPLLSVDSLNSYLHLFFTRFNTAYPLMHLETFNCADTEPLLLLSILLLGATYSSKDCHQLAVCIHDTILLVECFGKSRAGQKQHDMSHLFHGLLINLIRRSDCQSVRPPGPPPVGGDESAGSLDKLWKKWAEAEQKKRLALLCFMWDTQHAVLFCQSLCMSAFELRLELPCNQSIWEARDATEWVSAWRSSISDQRTFYLPVLKAYLMPSGPRTHGLSGFSRILVLHGLMSVAWDMGRRDQTALGVISGESPGPGSGWRKTLSSGYDAWRSDFDWYCNNFFAQMPRGPPSPDDDVRKMEFESFTAAYKALYHSAQALLNMDFLDVQIYAGARHILGRPVQQKDYMRSAQVVKRWASATNNGPGEAQGSRPGESSAATPSDQSVGQKQSATAAAWHAAQMLRETKKTLSGTEAMNLFHVPWCLYLATLTCWAFHHARPNRNYGVPSRRNFDAMGEFDEDEDCEEDEMIWDPQGEMDALISSMSERVERNDATLRREKRRTNGLVWIMADILTTVRWGIVHAGVVVLRGLVPQRLINQYEEAI